MHEKVQSLSFQETNSLTCIHLSSEIYPIPSPIWEMQVNIFLLPVIKKKLFDNRWKKKDDITNWIMLLEYTLGTKNHLLLIAAKMKSDPPLLHSQLVHSTKTSIWTFQVHDITKAETDSLQSRRESSNKVLFAHHLVFKLILRKTSVLKCGWACHGLHRQKGNNTIKLTHPT